jgi:CHAT domain-containing protein
LPSRSPQPIKRGPDSQAGAGQDRLTAGGQLDPSYRELYDVLVRPVRHWLPRGDGRLLTIVPHGPLLRLSFAALQNERGKYLLEGYRLHYTPALSVLEFTARRKRPGGDESLLLVASPSPSSVKAERLAPLPGAKREADAIARVSKGASLRVLAGADAREARIRENAGTWTTIHFAVHGIVSDERPLTSYLALTRGSQDAAADDDGRLTAGEIYGLDLRADLVVLSACRTAGGRVTGDGIVGLTRAFIYAGAASVVAPVWDLIDETTPQLFEAFYAARRRGEPTSAALRASQLQMLRALRAGSIAVATAAGRFVVPDHPSIWGGLQLWGEP